LMQLLPGTAEAEAHRMGGTVTGTDLTTDPARNMELGASYVRAMLARFSGSLPLAVAAYNAGPHRVDQWLHDNGDPRTGAVEMIDWIELIPFDETRNYVERVLENVVIYQARRGETSGGLTAQWMR
ncbi:MAG: lytic transglycosylase domain-containing protein, partial [Acetobacteraceae bacterium]